MKLFHKIFPYLAILMGALTVALPNPAVPLWVDIGFGLSFLFVGASALWATHIKKTDIAEMGLGWVSLIPIAVFTPIYVWYRYQSWVWTAVASVVMLGVLAFAAVESFHFSIDYKRDEDEDSDSFEDDADASVLLDS